MKEHQWEQVLNELDDQTLLENQNWKLYWNAGWVNYKIDEFNKAVDHFKKALELTDTPKDKLICLTFLGISELENKNYNQALEYLQTALQIKDSSITRNSLALTYMHLNNNEAAEKVHKEGIINEPENKERLAAYGDFLLDVGREEDAKKIVQTIKSLK